MRLAWLRSSGTGPLESRARPHPGRQGLQVHTSTPLGLVLELDPVRGPRPFSPSDYQASHCATQPHQAGDAVKSPKGPRVLFGGSGALPDLSVFSLGTKAGHCPCGSQEPHGAWHVPPHLMHSLIPDRRAPGD